MKTFTIKIDDKLDATMIDLMTRLHKTSKAETFRLAIALLKIATDGRDDHLKLALADQKGKIVREIVMPA